MYFINNTYFVDYDFYNGGMIYSQIKDILKNGPNVLSLVDLDYSLKFGLVYLPNSVKEFKYVILIFVYYYILITFLLQCH